MSADADSELLVSILRILVRHRNAANMTPFAYWGRVWVGVDRAIAEGFAPRSLATQLADVIGGSASTFAYAPGSELTHVRAALVEGLLRGLVDSERAEALWRGALAWDPPGDEIFDKATRDGLQAGLDAFLMNAAVPTSGELGGSAASPEFLVPRAAWLPKLLSSYLQCAGGIQAFPYDRPLCLNFERVGPHQKMAPAAGLVLRDALRAMGHTSGTSLALAILEDPHLVAVGVMAAIDDVVRSVGAGGPGVAPSSPKYDGFVAHLASVLNGRWGELHYGVDPQALLEGASTAVFESLESGDKVKVVERTLFVDSDYPSLLIRSGWAS